MGLVGGASLTGKVLFEIVVEVLLCPFVECPLVGRRNIRIQFPAEGGQIMDLDLVLVFLRPLFHPFCVMHSPMIDEEEDFLFSIVDQADDRAVEALGGLSHDRDLAFGSEASTCMGLRFCRSLVCPPNLCVFGLRACFQTRIGLPPPC